MDPVILMVGRINEGVHDIEVMPDVPAAELADAIALAFSWLGTYDIQVAGKVLAAHQTLAGADVWDGSQLVLVTSTRAPRPAVTAVRTGSRPLQVPDQAAQSGNALVTGDKRSLQLPVSDNALQPGDNPVAGKRALQIPAAQPAGGNAESWKPVIPEPPAQVPLSSPVTGWRQTPAAPDAPFTNKDSQP